MTSPQVRALIEGNEPPRKETKPVQHRSVTSEPLTHNPFEELRKHLEKRGFRHPFITKEREEQYTMSNSTTSTPEQAEPKRNRRVPPTVHEAPPPVPQQATEADILVELTRTVPFTPNEQRLIRYTRSTLQVGKMMVGAALVVVCADYIAKVGMRWSTALKGPKV